MTTWFTGDTHFGHENVIKYAKRPFANAAEMDEELVRRWNANVAPEDLVYHLGDVAFCKPERASELLMRLHGRKRIVFGNHDKQLRKNRVFLMHFEAAADLMEIKVDDATAPGGKHRTIVLCHYAMRVWNKSHHGAWQLYGHSHGTLPDLPNALQVDVGVDNWNYAPVCFEALRIRLEKKQWKPVDHHGEARDDDA